MNKNIIECPSFVSPGQVCPCTSGTLKQKLSNVHIPKCNVRTDISNRGEGQEIPGEEGGKEFNEGRHVHAKRSKHAPPLRICIKSIADLNN